MQFKVSLNVCTTTFEPTMLSLLYPDSQDLSLLDCSGPQSLYCSKYTKDKDSSWTVWLLCHCAETLALPVVCVHIHN